MRKARGPVEVGQVRRDPDSVRLRHDRNVRVLEVGVPSFYGSEGTDGVRVLDIATGRETTIDRPRLERWEVVK